MNCEKVGSLLSQYMEGDVSPRQASEVQAHLLTCRSCVADLERLTKAVTVLESTPKEEAQVDLYEGFRKRAAEAQRRRLPALSFPPARRWATAGVAVVLLVGGSLVGSWLSGPKTLYVSNPRSESPLFSSIAIAADQAQNRAGVDAPLFADSRLSGRIDVRSNGESLEKVIGMLSKKSRVKLAVDPEIAGQRVYLKLSDIPIAGVLAEIRRLFDLDWTIAGTGSARSYRLVCSDRVKKMSDAIAEAQAFSEAESVIRAIKTAVDERNPEPISKLGVSGFNNLGGVLTKMQNNPDKNPSPSTAAFFIIDDEAIATILHGGEYEKSYWGMSDQQKEAFRIWWGSQHSSRLGEKLPENLKNNPSAKVSGSSSRKVFLQGSSTGMPQELLDKLPPDVRQQIEKAQSEGKSGQGSTSADLNSPAGKELLEKLPPQIRESIQQSEEECPPAPESSIPPDAKFRAKLKREDTGTIVLSLTFATDNHTDSTGTSVFSPIYGKRNTNKLTVEDINELYATASASNPNYSDKRLSVKLGNGVYRDAPLGRNKPAYTLAEMLQLIGDKTDMQVVSDYFTVDQNHNRMIPIELTLGQLLAILDKDYGIAWSLSENDVLHLVHRQWPLLRQTEPAQVLVDRLNESIRRNGRLSLDDLADLADLSDSRLRGTLSGVSNREAVSGVENVVVNVREYLRLYGMLTPEQRRMVKSENGLSSVRMTEDQRQFAVWAAHGMPEKAAEMLPAEAAVRKPANAQKPFVFSIKHIRATYAEIEKMPGSRTLINIGGDGPSDFTIFSLRGGLDSSAAFNLPN